MIIKDLDSRFRKNDAGVEGEAGVEVRPVWKMTPKREISFFFRISCRLL